MNLYVIRHGETNDNLERKINGQDNSKLNEKGVQQAIIAAKNIKKLDIDLIISSPLERTKQTTDIINVNKIPVIYDKRLMERYAGDMLNVSLEIVDDKDWWSINPINDYKNAETVKEVFERVKKFLDELRDKYLSESILLVTHGGIYRAIEVYFNGIPSDGDVQSLILDNCKLIKHEV